MLIERTFGETRRVTVIGRLPDERSALSLVWAVLDGAAVGWRHHLHAADVAACRRSAALGIPRTRRKQEPAPEHETLSAVTAAA